MEGSTLIGIGLVSLILALIILHAVIKSAVKAANQEQLEYTKMQNRMLVGKNGDTNPPFSEQTDPPKLTSWQVHKKS